MKIVIVSLLVLLLAGCAQSPDDLVIEKAVTAAMKDQLPLGVHGNMLGGYATQIEEFEVLDKSYEKEDLNPFQKMLGGEPKNYWLITVRVKGVAQIGSNQIVASQFARGPDGKKPFHTKIQYQLFEREGGAWYAKSVGW